MLNVLILIWMSSLCLIRRTISILLLVMVVCLIGTVLIILVRRIRCVRVRRVKLRGRLLILLVIIGRVDFRCK